MEQPAKCCSADFDRGYSLPFRARGRSPVVAILSRPHSTSSGPGGRMGPVRGVGWFWHPDWTILFRLGVGHHGPATIPVWSACACERRCGEGYSRHDDRSDCHHRRSNRRGRCPACVIGRPRSASQFWVLRPEWRAERLRNVRRRWLLPSDCHGCTRSRESAATSCRI
jgi:hypothetical protein